jgi:hypothetical protein
MKKLLLSLIAVAMMMAPLLSWGEGTKPKKGCRYDTDTKAAILGLNEDDFDGVVQIYYLEGKAQQFPGVGGTMETTSCFRAFAVAAGKTKDGEIITGDSRWPCGYDSRTEKTIKDPLTGKPMIWYDQKLGICMNKPINPISSMGGNGPGPIAP